jgi:choline dehydrogenase-like flavoprotein
MAKFIYDAVIVGAGASGGWAAKRLTEAGMRVALLDAGRPQPDSNFNEHMPVFDLKYRDQAPQVIRRTRPVQKDCYACMEYNYQWFCNDLDEPYTTPADKPFSWQGRMRVTGGRTNVWARQSYRLSHQDFKAASFDGYGEDWPIDYPDLAPYYDIVERYIGVSGQPERVPELPDGQFLPPMAFSCVEMRLRERVKQKLGWTVTMGRTANLTRGVNGRAPCHFCGPCERGCITHSYFNAAFTTIPDAIATGRCTHIHNAMAWKVLMDPVRKLARGVLYVDRNTRALHEVRGRAVLLGAQAIESVRILFNSANAQFPDGLANSSGVLGHYLMDHVWAAGGASADFPDIEGSASLNGPNRPTGLYVIRFRNTMSGPRQKDFIRGYGFQGGGGSVLNWSAAGFGDACKASLRTARSVMTIRGFGECLPRWDNYVEIDRAGIVDTFGIPVVHIHMSYGENESRMIRDMAVSSAEMMDAAGGRNIQPFTVPDRVPGFGIHEVGIARMGDDPRRSVLNRWQQTHDVSNLLVIDGAGFTSTACQNPTLTIMALAVRASDRLIEEMKRGNV